MTMKSTHITIPATPGWFIVSYIAGLQDDQSDASLCKEPVLAWEIERCIHEPSAEDRNPFPWHEVTGIGIEGSPLHARYLGYQRPDETICLQEERDFDDGGDLLEYWRQIWIREHPKKEAAA